jgi:hypothetical protein
VGSSRAIVDEQGGLIVDPAAGGRRQAKLVTDGVGDGALRRLFHALERHRPLERHHHQLVLRGSRSRRRGRRYENLLLAAAVGQLQLDCLRATSGSGRDRPEVESVLLAEVEQELRRHVLASEQLRDRLSWIVRRRAEARARKRFEGIVAQVTAEVGGEMPAMVACEMPALVFGEMPAIVVAGQRSTSAEAPADEGPADAREPKLGPDAELGRCMALTRRGGRCRNPAGAGGLCDLHGDRDVEGIHADTVWAVGGFVLVAAVLAWAGLPVSEDAPVGSGVVVGKPEASAVTAVEAHALPRRHRPPADPDAADRDAPDGGRREAPKGTDAGDGESVDSPAPPEITASTDAPDAAPAPEPEPAPAPDGAADSAPNDGGAANPPSAGGAGARPDPVRGELVDEMLGGQ